MAARILVVDDNRVNRKLACDLLALEGHEVQECEDAEQARELLEAGGRPDLILMDIALPGMDGLTFTREIKADPRFAAMPVVAMTALAMKGDEQKALAAGCSGYITKPIDTRRLPLQVTEFLDAARLARSRLNVMIVEDHRIDLKLAGDCVLLSGHVVLSSTTAEEALGRLQDGHPDVVLLDLNLPGMDGLSFVRLLKADPKMQRLPIVAVTAYPDVYQRDELIAAGCSAYLVKPVDLRMLLQELERVATRTG
ncbi:response regulator [Piscinibacter sp. XHJ-5]|uniref:response regulator n=1 Tax=Piscinibacter sp. XHJ-5 TaxID=3037797 RepID=UPI002453466E|nr:response regulator [Piscinibacter sp. XHJ-5]